MTEVDFNLGNVEERIRKERSKDMEDKAVAVLKEHYIRLDKAKLAIRNIEADIEKAKADMPDNLIYESANVFGCGTVLQGGSQY